jgi:hypothetical protein
MRSELTHPVEFFCALLRCDHSNTMHYNSRTTILTHLRAPLSSCSPCLLSPPLLALLPFSLSPLTSYPSSPALIARPPRPPSSPSK